MISGAIILQRFKYKVAEAHGQAIENGRPIGQIPLKILVISDADSNTHVHLTFSPKEFDDFVQSISGNRIVAAKPGDIHLVVSPNGK